MTRYVGASSNFFPYSSVAYIEATFSDGSRASGTGTLVGRNDVLTAAHVIYDSVLGAAESVSVEFGRDGASRPYGSFDAPALNYFELNTATPGFLTQSESESDLALVSLADPIGDDIGWFALGNFVGGETYRVTGYPGVYREASGPRLMEDSGLSSLIPGFDLVSLDNFEVNPGNSGGPVWYSDPAGPVLVGAVSTDLWAAEVSAHYDIVDEWINGNDYLIPSLQRGHIETRFGIAISDTPVDDFATLLESKGWELPDTLYAELQSRDELLRYPALEGTIDPVIRLYTGMLGRQPDKAGVEYWVSQLNAGNGLRDLAAGFSASDEFTQLTTQLGGGAKGLIEALYSSVLGRSSDAPGQAYWLDQLENGRIESADMALAFTNSAEYQAESYSLIQGAKLMLWGVDLEALNPQALGFEKTLTDAEQAEAGALIRLYSGVLGRAPDEGGLDYWLEALASGQTLTSVAEAFFAGNEFLDNRGSTAPDLLIESLYQQVLARTADADGKAYWQTQLQNDDFAVGDLALSFTNSQEYISATETETAQFLDEYQAANLVGVVIDTEAYLLG